MEKLFGQETGDKLYNELAAKVADLDYDTRNEYDQQWRITFSSNIVQDVGKIEKVKAFVNSQAAGSAKGDYCVCHKKMIKNHVKLFKCLHEWHKTCLIEYLTTCVEYSSMACPGCSASYADEINQTNVEENELAQA